MKHILVTRIDDRLIHGQVVTAWIKQYPINKILIIDDELSRNKLMERIYKAAAPVGIEVVIMDQEMAEGFLKEDPGPKENLMILVKVPQVLEKLIGSGISIDKIILGGMGAIAASEISRVLVTVSTMIPISIACILMTIIQFCLFELSSEG